MSESNITRRILRVLRETYPDDAWYKIYTGPFQERGVPDIIGCHNGRFFGFEVKTPERMSKEGPTIYQRRQLDKIKQAGGIARVITSPQEALAAIGKRKS